ncbi:unnamed protein product [Leptidea sinapis]|uniref:Laminin EGF-like domain-containing protein n=1 Tax=Leptidea sinapis TaxID=189913 RepID=A0A5E4R8J3_9NEOP|nr:unnamed protein product [Leptidea sinapis]
METRRGQIGNDDNGLRAINDVTNLIFIEVAVGMTRCNCSRSGAESNEGYWGLERGQCRRCECGAGTAACDPVSGLAVNAIVGKVGLAPPVTAASEDTSDLDVDHAGASLLAPGAAKESVNAMRMDGMEQESFLAVHTKHRDVTISVPWPPVPVYAELGEVFLGDRVMSYGGALRFRVEQEGGEPLPQQVLAKFPLVSLHGGSLVLDYYERAAPVRGMHAVFLHESLWEVRGRGALPSRGALMLVLQQLRHVFVRVSTRQPTYEDPLHVLLLNVSLETAVAGLSRGAPAPGVEMCECRIGFGAGSCQRPAPGFWLPPTPPQIEHNRGTILINLVSQPKRCECNNRATVCHPTTGDCMRCANGYYGVPDAGCQPCPCPAPHRNRAVSCAPAHNRVLCKCQPGYSGISCESCAVGWVLGESGECEPCTCDRRGALSDTCDARARCNCRPYVIGDKCDTCDLKRHFLDIDGCRPCDNCTQTLLDSIEALTSDLHRRSDITELTRIPQPFPALRELGNKSILHKTTLHNFRTDLEKSRTLEQAIKHLEEIEHIVFTSANNLKTEAAKREKEAGYISLESMSGLEDVLKQRRLIGEQVAGLDDFARGEKHLSAHRALKEARHLLKKIKDIRLHDFIAGANDVSDSVNLQSTSVHEYAYRIDDVHRRLRKMQSLLDGWEVKMEDFSQLAEAVWSNSDAVVEVRRRVLPKMMHIKDIGMKCRDMLEDIANQSVHNLTTGAYTSVEEIKHLVANLPRLAQELQNLTSAAEEKEGILYSLVPTYKEKYLESVAQAVAEAGAEADDAARATAAAGQIARGEQPLVSVARMHRAVAEQLKEKGTRLLAKAEELDHSVETASHSLDSVSVGLRALGWRERSLASGASGAAAGLSGSAGGALVSLRSASAQAERVFGVSRALYDEAGELRRRVRYNLRRNLAALQRLGDTALGAAQEHEVSESLRAAAAARAREHERAAASLEPALRALRDRVQRALHAASTVTVSVRSPAQTAGAGAGCTRAYSTWSAPSVTRVSLALSFDNHVSDGTLVFIKDQEAGERYMRLSVVNRRLRLTWNVGGDDGVLVRLRVERSGSGAIASTNTSSAGGEPESGAVSGAASGAASGALRSSVLWLGETAAPLPACVHALKSDAVAIGLWAYHKQPSTAKRISQPRGSNGLVQFSGSGYAEVRRSGFRPADRRRFTLSFTFRTKDHNALLFFAVDKANNRSVSVWMRACRIVFAVQYGSGPRRAQLQIASSSAHCDGAPAHVQATRVFNGLERGSLRVNGEETLGSPSPPVQDAALLPDLQHAPYWVGGAPPGGDPPGGDLSGGALLGCLGALTVDREGYDLLDTPTRHGVEPGCIDKTLRSAIFEGEGYIELVSPTLRRKSSLGMSFRTRAPAGLLLYRCSVRSSNEVDGDGDDEHYLMISILEVWLDERWIGGGELRGGYGGKSSVLYVGGAPALRRANDPRIPANTFTGTVADLIGSKLKPKHFTALSLHEGKARLAVRGRKKKEVTLGTPIADGTWRSVTRIAGYRGCVRHVAVCGRSEDLVRNARDHDKLGQCFPAVERGAYFSGKCFYLYTYHYLKILHRVQYRMSTKFDSFIRYLQF